MRSPSFLLLSLAVALLSTSCGGGATVGTPCMSSRECSSASLVCDPALRTCQECAVTTDCLGAGEICQTSHCIVPTPCTSSRMCPGRVCDTADGYCVDCNMDVDCTTGLVCREHGCVMPAATCMSDRECSADGLVCDPVGHSCVECVRSADCTGGELCFADHRCAPSMDAGTPDAGAPDMPAVDAGPPTRAAFDVMWTITVSGSASTCAGAGAASVEVIAMPSAGGTSSDWTFACDAGHGLVPNLAFGNYTVMARMLDGTGGTIGMPTSGVLPALGTGCSSVMGTTCVHNAALVLMRP